jgi:nicotinate phosphoribosyltransferase
VHETGLLTDHYELTMVQAALRSSTASRRSVFELFARRLPGGRRYGVVAGTGRALDALEGFGFSTADLGWLSDRQVVDADTLEWLRSYRFTGSIWGYGEGDAYFPGSPLLVVESTFAEAVVLETVLLSIFNHDSAVASAASRMTAAASGRPCIEMGSRRTHESAAVAAARAAYIAGFSATSNLRAGIDHAIPTTGTAAHAFTLLHDTERDAFVAQVESLGRGTTLLVDTYDIREAVGVAVEVAGRTLGAVRIDSGDLVALAHSVRRQLDDLGATDTSIIVTSDLDEFAIAGLAAAPVNGYGVGTSLVTGSGAPTSGFVYKLVSRASASGDDAPLVTVAKKSSDKTSIGGRKWAVRRRNREGTAEAEVIGIEQMPHDDGDDRPLLVPLVKDGVVVGRESLAAARDRHVSAMAELPPEAHKLSRGEPAIPTDYLGDSRPASTAPFQQPSA